MTCRQIYSLRSHLEMPRPSLPLKRYLMRLAELLTAEKILLSLQAKNREEAIHEIVTHLRKNDLLLNAKPEEILELLNAREDQTSTGIGSGVAIPHAFSEEVTEVIAVFARSQEGVDFESLDNAPVHFIIMFIVPKKDFQMHLQTLAAIAKMFTNCDVRHQLGEAKSREEILRILGTRPSRSNREC